MDIAEQSVEILSNDFNSSYEHFIDNWIINDALRSLALTTKLARSNPLDVEALRALIRSNFSNTQQVAVNNGFADRFKSRLNEVLIALNEQIRERILNDYDIEESYAFQTMPEITKSSSPQIAAEAIKRLYYKGMVIMPSDLMTMLDGKQWLSRGAEHGMIMKLIEQGLKNAEICRQLKCSNSTVAKVRKYHGELMGCIADAASREVITSNQVPVHDDL